MAYFRFDKPQTVAEVGGVKVGGQPGENPTVLLGTMFYTGHKIVEDRKTCRFDRKRAEELINHQETLVDETGIPGMLDLVALSGEEIRCYIDFVTSVTDMPFSIDIWKLEPKLAAARYIVEQHLQDKAIYSSIAPWSEDIEREVKELKELKLKNAILVCYNKDDKKAPGKVKILEEFLIPKARSAGFKNLLADTSVLSLPAASYSFLANKTIKERFGLPTGCAPSNATDMWKTPKDKWGKIGFAGVDAAAHAIASLMWNDFLLYGPIESAPWIFPAAAAANTMLPILAELDPSGLTLSHPLKKLFGEFVDELEKQKQ